MNATKVYAHNPHSMRADFRKRLRAHLPLVGTMSDRALGALVGVSFKTARKYRRLLGIPPWRATVDTVESKAAPHLDSLGHVTDREFAALAGISVVSAVRLRARYGITPAPRKVRVSPPKPPKVKAPKVAAEKPKRTRNRKPLIDATPWLHLLGTLSDLEVARRAGCNESTARNWRTRRGIPSLMQSKRAALDAAATPAELVKRVERRKRFKTWTGSQLAVTKWSKAYDDEHDRPFLATTYADAVGVSVTTAVQRIEKAVARGEITEIDKHRPGVCGCYVVAA